MTDLEKYLAKLDAVVRVEEVTTKITCYNCFGDKVDERVKTTSSFYTLRKDKETGMYNWVKGNEEDK